MKGPTKEQVVAARERAGITQKHAAELCCVTRAAFQHWCYGRRQMPQANWELFQIRIKELKK